MMNFHGLRMNMVHVDGGRVKRRVEEVMILKLGLCLFSENERLMNRPSEGKKRRRRRSGQSVQSRDEHDDYSGESESENESEDDGKK